MKPPSPESGEDTLIWDPDPKGLFSVKSAYEVLVAADGGAHSTNQLWRSVWRWEGPNWIHFFLWLVAHNTLLTNSERRRMHISATDACERCKGGAEDALHGLRDCRFADQV
ncbi:Putative ribonuclease H protein At1g65750 [Linum perenne]